MSIVISCEVGSSERRPLHLICLFAMYDDPLLVEPYIAAHTWRWLRNLLPPYLCILRTRAALDRVEQSVTSAISSRTDGYITELNLEVLRRDSWGKEA